VAVTDPATKVTTITADAIVATATATTPATTSSFTATLNAAATSFHYETMKIELPPSVVNGSGSGTASDTPVAVIDTTATATGTGAPPDDIGTGTATADTPAAPTTPAIPGEGGAAALAETLGANATATGSTVTVTGSVTVTGTVSVPSGVTLAVSGAVTLNGGTVTVASGGTLSASGTASLGGTTTVTVASGGTATVTSGSLTLNSGLAVNGTLTIPSGVTVTVTSGSLTGTGTLAIAATGVLDVSGTVSGFTGTVTRAQGSKIIYRQGYTGGSKIAIPSNTVLLSSSVFTEIAGVDYPNAAGSTERRFWEWEISGGTVQLNEGTDQWGTGIGARAHVHKITVKAGGTLELNDISGGSAMYLSLADYGTIVLETALSQLIGNGKWAANKGQPGGWSTIAGAGNLVIAGVTYHPRNETAGALNTLEGALGAADPNGPAVWPGAGTYPIVDW
jgi:hypothetical protein